MVADSFSILVPIIIDVAAATVATIFCSKLRDASIPQVIMNMAAVLMEAARRFLKVDGT